MDIARQRLQNEHLIGSPLATPEAVVGWLGAVQAQDYAGAKWGIAQRTRGLTSAVFDLAFEQGKILRTHVMRPTWHFVLPEDIRWMLALTASRVRAVMAPYNRKLELDDALLKRCGNLFIKALQGGVQMTRAELATTLEQAGIVARGQRLAHIVMFAELAGVLCSGGLKGKQFTYALLAERAPHARELTREAALAELAARYIASHGPATLHDLAWWSGLTIADARHGLTLAKPRLNQEVIEGITYWYSPQQKPPVPGLSLHLLPNYDEYLIAYKGYGTIFDANHLPANALDALRAHILVRNGRVIGGWKRAILKDKIAITLTLLLPLSTADRRALTKATAAYGRFMELPVEITSS